MSGGPTGTWPTLRGRAEETSRRAVLLFGLTISRTRLAGTDLVVTAAGTLLLLCIAGIAAWAGTSAVGTPLGLGDAFAGTLNGAPIALLCIGAAMLALGWAPRAVLAIGALLDRMTGAARLSS